MHGGLFSKDDIKLDDIRATERYYTVEIKDVFFLIFMSIKHNSTFTKFL